LNVAARGKLTADHASSCIAPRADLPAHIAPTPPCKSGPHSAKGASHLPWSGRELWELFVKDGSGILASSRDSDDVAFREVIGSTDFPITYVRLSVEGGVLMLPSEH
jgi:hypothetical protein